MSPVTMTSRSLCRKAMFWPGMSSTKRRSSFRSAWIWFSTRSTVAAAPIQTCLLTVRSIAAASLRDRHGPALGVGRHPSLPAAIEQHEDGLGHLPRVGLVQRRGVYEEGPDTSRLQVARGPLYELSVRVRVRRGVRSENDHGDLLLDGELECCFVARLAERCVLPKQVDHNLDALVGVAQMVFEVHQRLLLVVHQHFGAELRSIAGAGGFKGIEDVLIGGGKDRQDHIALTSRNLGFSISSRSEEN